MPRKNKRAPRATRGGRRENYRRGKPKPCAVCAQGGALDWKDASFLRKFVSDRGKIRSRRVSGLCPRDQRRVATAVKNAREMALVPYVGTR